MKRNSKHGVCLTLETAALLKMTLVPLQSISLDFWVGPISTDLCNKDDISLVLPLGIKFHTIVSFKMLVPLRTYLLFDVVKIANKYVGYLHTHFIQSYLQLYM